MVDFIIDESWDCKDIDKILDEISIAEMYPSYGGQVNQIKKMLKERKKELGCP